uniref:TPR_REGION domain-containing protein n=1 Tax=Steinernema glaseri TaxID=37863 RepID=A0A1I7Y1H2_9BILA
MTPKLFLLVTLLPVFGLAILTPPITELSRDVYESLKLEPANFAATCNDVDFEAAQADFNKAINIDTKYKWRDAEILSQQVLNRMSTSAQSFLKVCTARTKFYQRMAMMYDGCINRLYLINKLGPSATNISAPYIYTEMWQQLDFLCNGGKELALRNFYHFNMFKTNPAFETCKKNFISDVNSDHYDFCGFAGVFIECSNKAYADYLHNLQLGWLICEELRVGFAYDCRDLRCHVIDPNSK